MAGGLWLPPVDFGGSGLGGQVPTGTLQNTGMPPSEQQVQAAAWDAPMPITYGRDRIAPLIYDLGVIGQYLVIWAIWGWGPYDGLESFTLDDAPAPAGVIATHYDGTQTTHNATLATLYGVTDPARLAQMVYPNVVYSVVRVPPNVSTSLPNLGAIWRGRKLYDPRTGLTAWSECPALALADHWRSPVYGRGEALDEDSVGALADTNDELVGGKPRRRIGLTLSSKRPVQEWSETLRAYAGAWVDRRSGPVRFIPMRPAVPVKTFSFADGNIKSLGPLEYADTIEVPTVVEVAWTDTSQIPWREAYAYAYAPGVAEGTLPVRLDPVPMPGIHDAGEAQRFATERLNRARLGDLSLPAELFDEAAALEPGDVIAITDPGPGFAAKEFRVDTIQGAMGDYSVRLMEEDPAFYSDEVVDHSTTSDTTLPNPANPPAVTGLAIAEEVYQLRDGTWATRLRITWDAAEWAYLRDWRVVVSAGYETIADAAWSDPVAVIGPVQEGVQHDILVYCRSSVTSSPAVSAVITPAGKYLLPGNIPSITAYEIGGEVRVTIGAAVDLDLKFYEVRYDDGTKAAGVGGETWASIWGAATFVDATPAASGVGGFVSSKMLPKGAWRLLACALDSVGQYSPTPATASVTVTSDINSFLVGSHDFTTPTLTGMAEYSLPADTRRYFVTEDGVGLSTKMTGALSAYTGPLAAQHASQTSEFKTEAVDFGASLSGSWNAELTAETIGGSRTDVIMTSADGSTYADGAGLAIKATGRFAKLKTSATGSSTIHVTLPTASLRVDAIPRTESASADVTSNASGATPVIVAGAYAAVKAAPTITPIAAAARQWAVDNITVCPYADYAGAGSFRGDGASAYISVPSYAGISLLSGTVEVLFLARAVPSTGLALIGKVTPDVGALDGYSLRVTSSGLLRGRIDSNGTTTNIDSTASVCDGKWHRASLRFSSTALTLAVDGVVVAQQSVSLSFRTAGPTSALGIGAQPPGNGGSAWSIWIKSAMQVADVRIWSTQRTDKEIFDNAFTALSGNETGLVGYWPLAETTGTTAANLVSGGNAGTRSGGLIAGRSGFDAYLFNSSGTQVADKFRWNWEGV